MNHSETLLFEKKKKTHQSVRYSISAHSKPFETVNLQRNIVVVLHMSQTQIQKGKKREANNKFQIRLEEKGSISISFLELICRLDLYTLLSMEQSETLVSA